jgi:hypothetical protein
MNFIVSERLAKERQNFDCESLEAYREESYDFILNYLTELFEGCNEENQMNFEILQKLKRIYEFGDVVIKPLVKRVLKLPQLHQIYLKHFSHA